MWRCRHCPVNIELNGPLTRQLQLRVAHAPRMPGTFSPPYGLKGHHWLAIPVCITSRTPRTCRNACRDRQPAVAGKTIPAFPAYARPVILRIWQEAHNRAPLITEDMATIVSVTSTRENWHKTLAQNIWEQEQHPYLEQTQCYYIDQDTCMVFTYTPIQTWCIALLGHTNTAWWVWQCNIS